MSGIVDFFKKVGREIKAGAEAFGHVFVAFFGKDASKEFVDAAEKILKSDFGKVIQSIIEGLMSVAASQGGAAARGQAFNEIKTAAIGAGLDLKDSLIYLLIELAVNKAKGTLAEISSASS